MKKRRDGKQDRPDILAELGAGAWRARDLHIRRERGHQLDGWPVREVAQQQEGPGRHPAPHLSVVWRRQGYAWLPTSANSQMKGEGKP
jgi:hypothetical protein